MSLRDGRHGARLSDTAIIARLLSENPGERIIITPLVDPASQIGPASVDLRLGNEFIVTDQSRFTHIDPATTREELLALMLRQTKVVKKYSVLEPFVLHPGRFTLGSTLEYIALPGDVAAHVEGRSTWARLGIQVHSTATNVHPWSRGAITFELQNIGELPVELYPGMRIGQLTFYQLNEPAAEPRRGTRKYQTDLRVAPSRFLDEVEMRALRARKLELEHGLGRLPETG
jgi:dCTP deaminase